MKFCMAFPSLRYCANKRRVEIEVEHVVLVFTRRRVNKPFTCINILIPMTDESTPKQPTVD